MSWYKDYEILESPDDKIGSESTCFSDLESLCIWWIAFASTNEMSFLFKISIWQLYYKQVKAYLRTMSSTTSNNICYKA